MYTISGRRFELGTKYAPSVLDIAIGLSRIPRWAGATVRPWSVLQHSLAAGALAEPEGNPVLHLAALMHDMEEMATGDIPTPFKTAQQVELAERLRAWLYSEVLVQPNPDDRTVEKVKAIDEQLKLAELLSLCHPRSWQDPAFLGLVQAFVVKAEPKTMPAVDAVWDLIDMPEREAIFTFTEQVTTLLQSTQLMAMRNKA